MKNSVNTDMSNFWNGEGGQKWLQFDEKLKHGLKPFGQMAMAAGAISSGDHVADVGCGSGDTTFEMANVVGEKGHVQGIDISFPILAAAERHRRRHNKQSVSFHCSDVQVHDFEPGIFDVVFSRFGVMFFEHPVMAFKNLWSALKPGGRLAFVAWQSLRDNEWMEMSMDVVARHLPVPKPSAPHEPGPLSFANAGRIEKILSTAGFSRIKIEAVEAPFILGDTIEHAVRFLTHLGPAAAVINKSEANDETRAHIVRDMSDSLEEAQTVEGVSVGARVWVVSANR